MAAIIGLIAGLATTTAVTGMVIAGITIGAFGAAIAGAVVSMVVGSALISKPSGANFNATAAHILTNKRANNAPIPVIYGTRRVGGTIVFMATTNETSTLTLNLVISEGVIEDYLVYYFDNEQVSHSNAIHIKGYSGTTEQNADSKLISDYPYYNDSHRLQGTAYIRFRIGFDRKRFPSGIPVINVLVKGIKTFDPRTNLIEWTDNPALCVRDYLTHSRYGRGIDPSFIDDTSFISAANYCDEKVAYNGTDLIKRYTCNGVAQTENSSLDIIKQLLSSCRGLLIFSAGLYKIIIDKPELAVFTFSEDNIIGGWNIKLGGKNSRFNRMRANFFNANKEYQADIAIVDDKELRISDGLLLERMIDLPFTTDLIRAKAITTIHLKQSRHSITCEFTATIEALRVEVGDVVYINHKTPGWDTHNSNLGKKFRIMRVTLQNNDEVRILANEYADEVYDLGVIKKSELTEKISIDDLSVCLPPTNLQLTLEVITQYQSAGSATNLSATWTASIDPYIESYEVSWKRPNLEWEQNNIGYSFFYTATNLPGRLWEFRVRAINMIGVESEWLT